MSDKSDEREAEGCIILTIMLLSSFAVGGICGWPYGAMTLAVLLCLALARKGRI